MPLECLEEDLRDSTDVVCPLLLVGPLPVRLRPATRGMTALHLVGHPCELGQALAVAAQDAQNGAVHQRHAPLRGRGGLDQGPDVWRTADMDAVAGTGGQLDRLEQSDLRAGEDGDPACVSCEIGCAEEVADGIKVLS